MFKAIKKIISWLAEHTILVLIGLLVSGITTFVVGIVNLFSAKKKNAKAIEIRDNAIKKYEEKNNQANDTLSRLGETKNQVIKSFDDFSDAIERIQNRPTVNKKIFKHGIPEYKLEEFKKLSNEWNNILVGAGGAAAGAIAGLAAYGFALPAAGPAVFVAGVAICARGVGLNKKAANNIKEAKTIEKEVDSIIAFYNELIDYTDRLNDALCSLFEIYSSYLDRTKRLVLIKTDWKDFSREEKKVVTNAVKLASILYMMCQIQVVVKPDSENELESVNKAEIKKIIDISKKNSNEAIGE